ncbi:MAG: hypothetical protein OQK74_10210, partial [Gammaproteobacteria bacterium]|nr:hypothetical protein [Gammaproteobacteria bacterium]
KLLNKNCFDVISTVVQHTSDSRNVVNSRILVTDIGDFALAQVSRWSNPMSSSFSARRSSSRLMAEPQQRRGIQVLFSLSDSGECGEIC